MGVKPAPPKFKYAFKTRIMQYISLLNDIQWIAWTLLLHNWFFQNVTFSFQIFDFSVVFSLPVQAASQISVMLYFEDFLAV